MVASHLLTLLVVAVPVALLLVACGALLLILPVHHGLIDLLRVTPGSTPQLTMSHFFLYTVQHLSSLDVSNTVRHLVTVNSLQCFWYPMP